jgi:hypothetical protein
MRPLALLYLCFVFVWVAEVGVIMLLTVSA